MAMASASTNLCPLPSTTTKLPLLPSLYSPTTSQPKIIKLQLSTWFAPNLRGNLFSPWNGLKNLSIPPRPQPLTIGRKRRCKGKVVYASLFGVGAPEVLVIGVVALMVFGPKGLAEIARNLGKSLRAFQPTIRELQEVSREFKSTLEKEIGLDEISSPKQKTDVSSRSSTAPIPPSQVTSNTSQTTVDRYGTSSQPRTYTTAETQKLAEEQLNASAEAQHGHTPPPEEGQFDSQKEPQGQADIVSANLIPSATETAAERPPQKPESET